MGMTDNDNKSIAKHMFNVWCILSTTAFAHYDLILYEVGTILLHFHFTDKETKARNG